MWMFFSSWAIIIISSIPLKNGASHTRSIEAGKYYPLHVPMFHAILSKSKVTHVRVVKICKSYELRGSLPVMEITITLSLRFPDSRRPAESICLPRGPPLPVPPHSGAGVL